MSQIAKIIEKVTAKLQRIRDLNSKRQGWPTALANLGRSQGEINKGLTECLTAQSSGLKTLEEKLAKLEEVVPKKKSGVPVFEGDGMVLYRKNVEWMQDPKFQSAYRSGLHSGHRIGATDGSKDALHLEWRTHIAIWAATHATKLEGDFVECGVNTGILSLAICRYVNFAALPKKFWLFDTYCGIPTEGLGEAERTRVDAMNAAHYDDCYDVAVKNFAPYPNAHCIRGLVPGTLPQATTDKVAYLSIDMNLAEPELAALEYFWPKLVSGAIVVLDDFGFVTHELQRDALSNFAEKQGVMIVTLPTGQGLLIKP